MMMTRLRQHSRFSPSPGGAFAAILCGVYLFVVSSVAEAARVLIVGDTQYSVVAETASDIQLSLRSQAKQYSVAEVKGRLAPIVERENAKVVVALGTDALAEALRLPPAVRSEERRVGEDCISGLWPFH